MLGKVSVSSADLQNIKCVIRSVHQAERGERMLFHFAPGDFV